MCVARQGACSPPVSLVLPTLHSSWLTGGSRDEAVHCDFCVCGSPCPLMLSFPLWSLPPMVASVVFLGVVIGVHGLGVLWVWLFCGHLPSGHSSVFPSG